MEASFVFKKFDVEVVSSIFKKYPLTKGIFSTVIDKDDELVEYLGAIFGILCFWTKRYLFRSRCNIKRLKRW